MIFLLVKFINHFSKLQTDDSAITKIGKKRRKFMHCTYFSRDDMMLINGNIFPLSLSEFSGMFSINTLLQIFELGLFTNCCAAVYF